MKKKMEMKKKEMKKSHPDEKEDVKLIKKMVKKEDLKKKK